MLPGRRDGTPCCRECAGITREFSCRRCGYEGEHCLGRLCAACSLAARLDRLLDDGTGQPNPALGPLAAALRADPHPLRVAGWLSKPHARILLADLATGRTELSHAALAARPERRAATYLRDLLVTCGVLPAADRQLLDYQAWLGQRLASLHDHPHQRLLHQFGHWHQLAKMRAVAATRPLRPTARQYAEQRFRAAETFLTWLHARDREPAATTQADIDAFYLTHLIWQRQAARAFLIWAIQHGDLPRLDIPQVQFSKGEALTQDQRLGQLRALATSDDAALGPRVAACLMLLHGLPLFRIIRLTTADIIRDEEGHIGIRLGDPPIPVPEPFAGLLTSLASHAGDGWLFPGRHVGQHLAYTTMHRHLRALGLLIRPARAAALRDLVLQVPAPVAAAALGFHHTTTQRQRAAAGATWSRYATRR